MRRKVLTMCAFLLVTAAGYAQEQVWHVSAGVVYRDFDDIEVKPFYLRNADTMCEPGGPFGIQGYSMLPGLADGSGVTVDLVGFEGMSESPDGEWGPTLGIQRDIYRADTFVLRLTASVSYFQVNADFDARGSDMDAGRFFVTHYNYLVNDQQVVPPPTNDRPLIGFSPGTSARVSLSEFEMDTIVVDLGLRAQMEYGRLYILASAGPALYWVDATSELTQSGSWNAIPGTGDTGQYRMSRSDSDSETEYGYYASAGAGVALTDRLNLEAAVRWDDVSDEVGTSQAAIDLDGFSGQIRLLMDF